MSQYKKGTRMLTDSLVIFAIAVLATLTIIVVMSSGIGGIADNAINTLVQN